MVRGHVTALAQPTRAPSRRWRTDRAGASEGAYRTLRQVTDSDRCLYHGEYKLAFRIAHHVGEVHPSNCSMLWCIWLRSCLSGSRCRGRRSAPQVSWLWGGAPSRPPDHRGDVVMLKLNSTPGEPCYTAACRAPACRTLAGSHRDSGGDAGVGARSDRSRGLARVPLG